MDHVTELLSPYLDGQVTAGERRQVERHLAACASCREELGSLRQVVALVRQLPQQPLPHSFTLGPRPEAA
ncbi:MAG: zf-HC2 domain-containing protein, partial [Chloroflexota bacterium]|nr:zf-HC2 domain-containing protein [Chloroflexota bacterium]